MAAAHSNRLVYAMWKNIRFLALGERQSLVNHVPKGKAVAIQPIPLPTKMAIQKYSATDHFKYRQDCLNLLSNCR